MRLSLLSVFILFICVSPFAQGESSDDGGNAFVEAYVTAQQGEKAEQAGNFKVALAKLRAAAKDLEAIANKYPAWSPSIVKYRKERTAEAIVRVQEKLAHFGGGRGGGETGAEPNSVPEPRLPEKDGLIFNGADGTVPIAPPDTNPPPIMESVPPRNSQGRRGSRPSDDGDYSGALNKVEQRMKDLEAQLAKAHSDIEQMKSEKVSLVNKLKDAEDARKASEKKREVLEQRASLAETALRNATNAGSASQEQIAVLLKEYNDSKKLVNKAKIEAEADAEYRTQLDERYKAQITRISVLIKERDDARSQNKNGPAKIEAIQKQLDATKKEKEALAQKLQRMETQLTEVSKQRDTALAEVDKLKDAQKQVDKLVADNASLMVKLADAQKSVAQFKAEGVEKDKQIADLKKEVTTVKQQLEDTRKQSADYQKKMGDLQEKLESTAKQLAEAKSENTETAAEKKKMQDENRILRDIVLREQRKEADRQAMKKVVLGELTKLEINSKTLLKQIDFLSEPTVKLTPKERALFKKPELQVTDTEISIALMKDEPAAPSGQVNPEISVPDEPRRAAPKPPEAKPPEPIASTPSPVVAPTPASTPAPAAKPAATPSSKPTPTPAVTSKASPPPAAKPAPASTPAPAAATPPPQLAKNDDSQKPLISLNPQVSTAPTLDLASNTSGSSPLFDSKLPEAPAPASAPSVAPPLPEATSKNVDESTPPLVTPDNAPNTAITPPVPAEFIPLARQGKEQFERGNYLDAERAYRKILAKSPRNLYTLSNLGVVLFRSGKYKLAEEMFNKAIAVAPEDGFSHCTLGIVYYQESKLDEAVNELTKALAINPKNPTAHNYLGITASQKGWPEAAQKELETAVSLDANYADAYFNLAVVFATQQPPNKEEAKKYYKRAVELGAEADAALEQLIK